MTIPTYDVLMLPVLRRCSTRPWVMKDLVAQIANDLKLGEDEQEALLPSGTATIIASRVHWAKTYLKQSGLLIQPKRGVVEISDLGREVLNSNPSRIDVALLQNFEGFRAFLARTRSISGHAAAAAPAAVDAPEPLTTPEEQIVAASQALDEALRDALLARILEESPSFFERLIIDLLLAMGYGGSRAEAGEHLGRTGDGGIDGVIREDQLGLDRIYLQAKRFSPGNVVGSETVQAFIGALVGKGAHKGVLITTSSFSGSAASAARQSGSLRLVLIDGATLTNLMIRFNVGVRVAQTVEIKKVDLDYFDSVATE
jgi:restriction system protein